MRMDKVEWVASVRRRGNVKLVAVPRRTDGREQAVSFFVCGGTANNAANKGFEISLGDSTSGDFPDSNPHGSIPLLA
jgi:hypothetical protein